MNAPIQIGTIAENGAFTIELTKDFVEKTLQGIDGFNENSDDWKASISNVGKAFSCNSETVEIVNSEEPIINVANFGNYGLGNIDERKMYGSFMIVNNQEFGRHSKPLENTKQKKAITWIGIILRMPPR